MREVAPGLLHLDLIVAGIHCAGCIARIEKALLAMPGVTRARVNVSTKRVAIDWRAGESDADVLIERLSALGYEPRPFCAEEAGEAAGAREGRELLRALAVAGFAAANVMLLSVSVWSGASDATRDLFHWLSAMIALPALVYAGRPFFRSAWRALKARHLNMDVPISLGVILAASLSLYETSQGGAHAYFDASVTLLFFLLVGRYLDYMMRARARSAVSQLLALSSKAARVIDADGNRRFLPIAEIRPGMTVAVAAGEKLPVDGEVLVGTSDLDRSFVTGESIPEAVKPGDVVQAGSMNLTGSLQVKVTAANEETFLAEVVRLMEAAEQTKARYVQLADRVARGYAPTVHILAAATFLGWFWYTGGDWRIAIFTAIATLIITCPCALALAVPTVQVVASGVLFRRGIMVKSGAALERLSAVDRVVFDKTGTLTLGRPRLVGSPEGPAGLLAVAAGLARESSHPLSRALADALAQRGVVPQALDAVQEVPGQGLRARSADQEVRLGSRSWCGLPPSGDDDQPVHEALSELCLSTGQRPPLIFRFEDTLRPDAVDVIADLRGLGLPVTMLSGDRPAVAARVAEQLGIDDVRAGLLPQDKVAAVEAMGAQGHKVLMVGDGINDAPALAAGHAAIAPASAADVGRTAADFVFLGDRLGPVSETIQVSRRATALVEQNFTLALLYNIIAVPIAVLGFATPMVAAIAMSASSLVVTGNALRLRLGTMAQPAAAPPSVRRSPASHRLGKTA